jgi:hypothetical protein
VAVARLLDIASRVRSRALAWALVALACAAVVPEGARADVVLTPSCSGAAIDFGTITPGVPAVTASDCTITFGSNTDVAGVRLYQADGVGTAMGTIPDFVPGTSDWTSGTAAFGACLRASNAGVAATWAVDGDGSCTSSNTDPWRAILPVSTTASEVAQTTSSGINDASIQLRFGLRTAPTAAVGTITAPLVVEVLAPNVAAPTNVTLPVISGSPSPGLTLTATPGAWTGSPTSYAYQWQRCSPGCVDIGGATTSAYVLTASDLGATIQVRVTATNASGSASATSNPTATISSGPVNLVPPAITGETQTAQTLTSSTGSWSGSPTSYAYQWLRCDATGASCTPIGGATASSYLLSAVDLGSTIRITVTATDASGSGAATSMNTTVITDPPEFVAPVGTSTTKSSGTSSSVSVSAGIPAQRLLVLSATWLGTGATPSVADTRGNVWTVDVLGTGSGSMTLTASTYVTNALSGGDTITLTLDTAVGARGVSVNQFKNVSPQYALDVADNDSGSSTTPDSTGATTGDPVELAVGSIGANGPATDTFTIGTGFTALPSAGTTGQGAASNMTIFPEYKTLTTSAFVSGNGTLGTSRPWVADIATYRADPGSAPTNMVAPTIAGSAIEGTTLTVTSAWSGRPTSLTYQWRRCDAAGANCVDIAGATSTSYLLKPADIGFTIRVVATARNGRGTTTATTSATGVVQGVAPTNLSLPTVSGTVFVGNVVTANRGSWNGTAPLGYAYQWQRCDAAGANCIALPGETSTSYTVVAADDGNSLRVVVTTTNTCSTGCGTAAATSSAAPYVYPPVNTALPTISGLPEQQRKQTASTGTWTYSPTLYVFQWVRCDSAGAACADIAGATASTYRPQAADLNMTLRVRVTASNAAGSTSATSLQSAVIGPTVCGLPEATVAPDVTWSGQPVVGVTLDGSPGTWICSPTLSYQWYAGGAPISGETSLTLKTTTAEKCSAPILRVTATNAAGSVVESAFGPVIMPSSGPLFC